MTHKDVYTCDRMRCQEEKPAVYTEDTGPRLPFYPAGWYSLTGNKHFCSLACLAIWARAERKAANPPSKRQEWTAL